MTVTTETGRTGRSRPLRALACAGAVVLASAPALLLFPTQPANADSTFEAFARANAFDVVVNNQSIPTGIDVEGAGPAAQARRTSLGVGDSNAQFPYTGNTVPGVPGLASGLFGIPVPPYPLIAAATLGGSPQNVSYPGVDLRAESGERRTSASGTAGTETIGATTTASIEEKDDGSVVAAAQSELSGLKLGPVISISGVKTSVTVTADATGKLTRQSTTSIGKIDLPALELTLPVKTPNQIPIPIPLPGVPNIPPIDVPVLEVPLGGTTLKAPSLGIEDGFFTVTLPLLGEKQKFVVPAGAVLDALKASGIIMTFQAPQELANGVISGAYSFKYVVPAPPQNPLYTGPTTITQSTGLAVATVGLKPVPQPGGGTTGSTTGTGTGTGTTGGTGSTSGGSVPPGLGTESGSGTTGLDGSTSGLAPEVGLPPDVAGGESPVIAEGPTDRTASPSVTFTGFAVGEGLDNLYLALVGIALGGFVAATAMRLIGVRFLWSS